MFSSESEIHAVVRGFETCETGKTAFKHRDHLTVAVWYLQTMDTKAAVERMRAGLTRFLDHHGVPRQKYSEEITVYWMELIAEKLAELTPNTSIVNQCNHVISSLAHIPATRAVGGEWPGKS